MSVDLCLVPVTELYMFDPSSVAEPVGFVSCSQLGSSCETRDCSCRNATTSSIDGSVVELPVCVDNDEQCQASQAVICDGSPGDSTASGSSGLTSTKPSSGPAPSPAVGRSNIVSTSYDHSNTTILLGIAASIVAAVALVALLVRRLRKKRNNKLKSTNRGSMLPSPANTLGRTRTSSPFPALDPRSRRTSSWRRQRSVDREHIDGFDGQDDGDVGGPYAAAIEGERIPNQHQQNSRTKHARSPGSGEFHGRWKSDATISSDKSTLRVMPPSNPLRLLKAPRLKTPTQHGPDEGRFDSGWTDSSANIHRSTGASSASFGFADSDSSDESIVYGVVKELEI